MAPFITVAFNGSDLAGNAAASVSNTNVTYDVTAPVISATAPITNAHVKDTKVSYTLSEAIAPAPSPGLRPAARADGGSSSYSDTHRRGVQYGRAYRHYVGRPPTLVDGTIYSITYNATDLAGNDATPVSSTGIIYDVTLPVISSTALRQTLLWMTRMCLIPCQRQHCRGTITWTRTGGPLDGGSPHIHSLAGGELNCRALTRI